MGWDWGPVPGQQFGDPIGGMVGNAVENVGELSLGIDAVEPGGLDQRVHGGGSTAAGVGAGEEIVLAAEGDGRIARSAAIVNGYGVRTALLFRQRSFAGEVMEVTTGTGRREQRNGGRPN